MRPDFAPVIVTKHTPAAERVEREATGKAIERESQFQNTLAMAVGGAALPGSFWRSIITSLPRSRAMP